MAQLTLYTNPMSRGQIAHWMMEELGQPYETVWLPWGPEGHRSPSYLALNPMGKIPTVTHGDRVITEAAAICLYLAEAFPEAGLLPAEDERADYYRWTLFAAGPVEQAVTSKAMGWEAPDREATLGFGNYDRTVATLTGHFEDREYVCGGRFTAADVYVGSSVLWGVQFGTLPKEPSLVAYAKRLTARDAHRRCKVINDEKRAATEARA